MEVIVLDYCYSKYCPICNVFGSYPHLCSRCMGCFFVQYTAPKEHNVKAVCTISYDEIKKWFLETDETERKQFILDKASEIKANMELELFESFLQDFYNDEDTVTWTQPARSGKKFDLDLLKNSVEYLWNDRFNVYNPPIDSKEEFNRKFYEAVSSTMICPDWDSLANRINPVVLEVFEEEMGGE